MGTDINGLRGCDERVKKNGICHKEFFWSQILVYNFSLGNIYNLYLQCIHLQYVIVCQTEGVLIRKQLFLFYNFEREEEVLTAKLRACYVQNYLVSSCYNFEQN